MNGMNLRSVKSTNRTLILYLLNKHKSLSRKEIASKLSLTPAAVTKICQSLIEDGYIYEGDAISDTGKSGRREVMLSLCLDDKLVLGINAERDTITYSCSNLAGELIAIEHQAFCDDVDEVVKKAMCFISTNDIDIKSLLGVGVCVIGNVDDQYSIWKCDNLKGRFEKAFGIDVVIENNVKAFAQSEMIYGNKEVSSSALFLKWGAGIGSSIIANGEVFSGNDSGVAEIGHYIVDPSGKKCRCGRFGCLETVASVDAIIEEIGENISIEDIVNSHNNDIINLVDHKIDLVALALTNTATILNTDNVVLFGKMFNNKTIAEKLSKQCIRYNSNFAEDTIVLSKLNSISDYIGTTAICAKNFYFEREVI